MTLLRRGRNEEIKVRYILVEWGKKGKERVVGLNEEIILFVFLKICLEYFCLFVNRGRWELERERLKVLEGKVYFGGKILNGIKVIEISFWKDERIFFFLFK